MVWSIIIIIIVVVIIIIFYSEYFEKIVMHDVMQCGHEL